MRSYYNCLDRAGLAPPAPPCTIEELHKRGPGEGHLIKCVATRAALPVASDGLDYSPDGTMALVRVRRYLLGVDLWELPIGGMQEGERPLDVARKELREEAGLVAEDWTALGVFAPYKGVSNERCHVFLARDLREVPQELEPSEQISVHRMPIVDARRTLLDQECGDGQSMAGLMLLDRWLAAGNVL